MSDYTELKRLAEAANAVTGDVSVEITISSDRDPNQPEIDAVTAFVGAATPVAILALIAENERLHLDNSSLRGSCARLGAEHAAMSRNFKKANRMQFEARTDRDQLKAENEALRKDADRYVWLRDKSENLHGFYLSTPIWMTGVRFSKENVDSTIDAAIANGEQA